MITRSLPNFFTIANLFLGIIAILLMFNDNLGLASMLVIIAMLSDGLDGRVARALNAQSEFGKELDSLSDVISFGVAPAFIMYVAAFQYVTPPAVAWIVTAIFPICGALRLARFNVVAGTPGYFTGLPIPAAGGVLCTLALFHEDINTALLMMASLLLSYLMVSKVQYPSFKKVGLKKSLIWITPLFLLCALGFAVIFPNSLSKLLFIPLLLYALWGLKHNVNRLVPRIIKKSRGQDACDSDDPIEQEN